MATISEKGGNSIQRFCTLLKNKAITSLNRPQRALLAATLLALVVATYFLSSGSEANEPIQNVALVHPENDSVPEFETFAEVAEWLRGDDKNLVRPSPSDETWDRQETEACGTYLDQAHQALVRRRPRISQDDLVDAVRVISLCTTDRPEHRAKLTNNKGVTGAIVSLLKTDSYDAMAVASECIWISTFASEPNHKAFVSDGAVEKLALVVTGHDCNKLSQAKSACHVAQMWAGAALQNLAAAYCKTDDWEGGCQWVWQEGNGKTRHPIVVDEGMSVVFNPEPVRLTLFQNTFFLEALKRIICSNVKELEKAPWERTWPSRAQITETAFSASVAAWGAIGAIRNLALSPKFYDKMPQGLQECLCEHVVRSPDWLENTKAYDAIYRFGLDAHDVCEPSYDRRKCSDYKDWVDYEGNTCRKYEKERWCAEFRDYLPSKEEYSGDNYVKPREGCCACGGGKQKN